VVAGFAIRENQLSRSTGRLTTALDAVAMIWMVIGANRHQPQSVPSLWVMLLDGSAQSTEAGCLCIDASQVG
jgi:hypothetical protein